MRSVRVWARISLYFAIFSIAHFPRGVKGNNAETLRRLRRAERLAAPAVRLAESVGRTQRKSGISYRKAFRGFKGGHLRTPSSTGAERLTRCFGHTRPCKKILCPLHNLFPYPLFLCRCRRKEKAIKKKRQKEKRKGGFLKKAPFKSRKNFWAVGAELWVCVPKASRQPFSPAAGGF